MKPAPLLLALTGLALVAAAGGCAWILARHAPGLSDGALYMDAGLVAKTAMILSVPLTLAAVVIGGIGLVARGQAGAPRLLLVMLALACAALGVLACLYVWMTIQAALRAVGGPVSFAVTAPAHAEALLALAVGLFGALVAQAFHLPLSRRR